MDELIKILPQQVANALKRLSQGSMDSLTEIRLRVDRPAYMYIGGIEYGIGTDGISRYDGYVFSKDDALEMWRRLCNGSPYSTVKNQRSGFVTLGGNRIGFSGSFAADGMGIKHLDSVQGYCIRVAHQVKGCANRIYSELFENSRPLNTLIVSPPGCGKTTLLRDICRILSCDGFNVCLADERDEIAASVNGIPTLDVGKRCDVISGIDKGIAIENMIRTLRPDVVIADELGNKREVSLIHQAHYKGVTVIASMHGRTIGDVKEYIGTFQRYVLLSSRGGVGTVERIYDGDMVPLSRRVC